MDKRKRKADLILIAGCLLLSLAVLFFVNIFSREGKYAVVKVDGKTVARYSLSEDREEIIETEYGTNILVIKDGYADITDADCPDGLCEKQRGINKEGESLVCLPHKLTVTVDADEGVDLAA